MFAAVEPGSVLCSDSNILCMSWKGRVPKSEKEKPVCRRRCYEEGWLATGNGRGVVGVTFTASHCKRERNTPQRINFNLRGHNNEAEKEVKGENQRQEPQRTKHYKKERHHIARYPPFSKRVQASTCIPEDV